MKALFDSKTKHDGTNLLPTSPKPREVARALNLCTDRTLDMIAEAVEVPRGTRRQAPRMLAEAMLVRERTYTERLEALERKVAQHDRDIEQLKRATGLK